MSSIYQHSKLGESLKEALKILIKDGKVTPHLADNVFGEVRFVSGESAGTLVPTTAPEAALELLCFLWFVEFVAL